MSIGKFNLKNYPLKYRLKLLKNGEVVSDITFRKKTSVMRRYRAQQFLKNDVYLRVDYGIDGHYNDYTFDNLKDFQNSLDVWTEKELIKDLYAKKK